MSARDTVLELLDRAPFEPFRIVTTRGAAYTVRNPHLVALLRSEVFIAQPNSDRRTYIPWRHISAVETPVNGRAKPRRR